MTELAVFAKYWGQGQVKTRLAASIGDRRARWIYRQFLRLLLARLQHLADRRTLVYWPPGRRDEFAQLVGTLPWRLTSQVDGDLGQRLEGNLEQSLASGATQIVVIGSDSPTVPIAYLQQAWGALGDYDVVLGPAEDGGYYLLGARRRCPEIFRGIAWSSPAVCEQTVARLKALAPAISYCLLPRWYDVDDRNDLVRLVAELEQGDISEVEGQLLIRRSRRFVD